MRVVGLENKPVSINVYCNTGVEPMRKVVCYVRLTYLKSSRGQTCFSPAIDFVNCTRSTSLSFFLPHIFPVKLPDGAIDFKAYCDTRLKRSDILTLAATQLAGRMGSLGVALMPRQRGLELALRVGDITSMHYWQTPIAHRFFRFS